MPIGFDFSKPLIQAMLTIYIGYDKAEPEAFYVLQHSIRRRSRVPIAFVGLDRETLRKVGFTRPRGEKDSTDFAISRFLVPYLQNYEGLAVFMDCDMLCLAPIDDLIRPLMIGPAFSLACVQHDYQPRQSKKFLDQEQTAYPYKNWSSLMVFNCGTGFCKQLTLSAVNYMHGLDLHQFHWMPKREPSMRALPKQWNYLVGEDNQCDPADAKIVHFTNGGPWFPEYVNCEFSTEWGRELGDLSGYTRWTSDNYPDVVL